MVLLAVLYAIIPFLSNGACYKSLDSKMVMGEAIAANSSGNLIAFAGHHETDTAAFIMGSSDSGRHFAPLGGPWPGSYINKISIAPDDKSIVALGNAKEIYVMPAGRGIDSFISIHLNGELSYISIAGYCFVPQTDSVYFFGLEGNVLGLDYKKCDSFVVAHLHNIGSVYSMSINAEKEIVLLGRLANDPSYEDKMIVDNYFDQVKRYASAEFGTNNSSEKNSKHSVDSTATTPVQTPSNALDTDANRYLDSSKK